MERGGRQQQSHPSAATAIDFIIWADGAKSRYEGRDGLDTPRPYIPWEELCGYWSRGKYTAAQGKNGLPLDFEHVQASSLRFFSLLVYLDQVVYFRGLFSIGFNDDRFPLRERRELPESPAFDGLFAHIEKHQWLFFPLIVDSRKLCDFHVDDRQILPICVKKFIAEEDSAAATRISVIQIHESCNALDTFADTYVLKTYPARRKDEYERELKSLCKLRHRKCRYITNLRASFHQNGAYHLILDHVDGPNLSTYLEQTKPPSNPLDVCRFWQSFLTLLKAVHHLHCGGSGNEEVTEFRILHQDIKPDNVLVSRNSSASNYEFVCVLADFGHSDTRDTDGKPKDALAIDHHGNRDYGPPECSHHDDHLRGFTNRVRLEADIWNIGAVMSEIFSWLADGQHGMSKYWIARTDSCDVMEAVQLSGNHGAFHNGINVSGVVKDKHQEILRALHPDDQVTPGLLRLVEERMLVREAKERMGANDIIGEFQVILQKAQQSLPSSPGHSSRHQRLSSCSSSLGYNGSLASAGRTPPSSPPHTAREPSFPGLLPYPTSPSSPQHAKSEASRRELSVVNETTSSHLTNTDQPVSDENLSYEAVRAWYEACKNRIPPDAEVEQAIQNLKNYLAQERDYIFFIDDTPSMKARATQLEEAFRIYAYLAKNIDPDNIELCFASSPTKLISSPNTTALVEKLQNCRYGHNPSMIQFSLKQLFEQLVPRLPDSRVSSTGALIRTLSRGSKSRPISIFVFTDAKWVGMKDRTCGIEDSIRFLVDELKARGRRRFDNVMLQLLRFGDDPDGEEYCRYLDNFGEQHLECDIVDTRRYDGNVQSAFIGSLSRIHDRRGDD